MYQMVFSSALNLGSITHLTNKSSASPPGLSAADLAGIFWSSDLWTSRNLIFLASLSDEVRLNILSPYLTAIYRCIPEWNLSIENLLSPSIPVQDFNYPIQRGGILRIEGHPGIF